MEEDKTPIVTKYKMTIKFNDGEVVVVPEFTKYDIIAGNLEVHNEGVSLTVVPYNLVKFFTMNVIEGEVK